VNQQSTDCLGEHKTKKDWLTEENADLFDHFYKQMLFLKKLRTFLMKLELWGNVNHGILNISDHSNAAFDSGQFVKEQLRQTYTPVISAKKNSKPTAQICVQRMQHWSEICPI